MTEKLKTWIIKSAGREEVEVVKFVDVKDWHSKHECDKIFDKILSEPTTVKNALLVNGWHSKHVCSVSAETALMFRGWHSEQDCPKDRLISFEQVAKEEGWKSPEDWQKAQEQLKKEFKNCMNERYIPYLDTVIDEVFNGKS